MARARPAEISCAGGIRVAPLLRGRAARPAAQPMAIRLHGECAGRDGHFSPFSAPCVVCPCVRVSRPALVCDATISAL
eukprot:scaffold2802_cov110-Isochrysis_galbana.AAC.12